MLLRQGRRRLHPLSFLTANAAVRTLADEWDVVAKGSRSNGDPEPTDCQEIGIRVLKLQRGWEKSNCVVGDGTTTVHAWANSEDPDDDRLAERVRVGRLLTRDEMIARGSYDSHILAVADELLPVASSVGSGLSGLGLERVPSNFVGEAFGAY
jgi:hypothetical protein